MAKSSNYRSSFRSTVRDISDSVKGYVSDKYNAVKSTVKGYTSKVNDAYNVGYYSGIKDYQRIPRTFGSRTSAITGYGIGLRDSHRNMKYKKKNK